jgi:hypothetical protein
LRRRLLRLIVSSVSWLAAVRIRSGERWWSGLGSKLGAVLAFVAFTVVAFAADSGTAAFVDRYARAIAAGLLSLIAFGSLLVVPFTEQYARETVARQFRSLPQFTQINWRLTTMWGLVFAAMVTATVRSWGEARGRPRGPCRVGR